MKIRTIVALALLMGVPTVALAQLPDGVIQGGTFNLPGKSLPKDTPKANLVRVSGNGAPIDIPVNRKSDESLDITVDKVPPDLYKLSLVFSGSTITGLLNVYAPDDPQISKVPSLPEITRGQQVTINGKKFRSGSEYKVLLKAGGGNPSDGIELDTTAVADKLTFSLPSDKVAVARYVVWVKDGERLYPVPGDLRVLADESAAVTLDAVFPFTVYPSEGNGLDFEISGKNLGAAAASNQLIVVGRGPVVSAECIHDEKDARKNLPCLEVEKGMETRKLKVFGFERKKYEGPVSVQVQVGKNISNALVLTFSRVSERGVFWGAVALFLAIMFIVVRLVWKGVGASMGSKRYSPWTGFFLDKETNSYSLSKFQLLVWTSVFMFGYLYLFLSRMLIQWRFELPPVPDGLPGMLAISAGTVVAAAGATESRGSKGAGAVHPSAADFISTGGIVVGERFQFFVWTLVGAFGFLSLLVLADPAKITELPKIPDNFLYLMGISSVGYLAGKVTRKPGPVIRTLMVSNVAPGADDGTFSSPPSSPPAPPNAQMTLQLQGENISEKAKVNVDDKELRSDQYTLTGTKHQDEAVESTFCTELTLVLGDATNYLDGEHKLILTNRDGQAASAMFPMDPMAIDAVVRSDDGKTVTLTGKNFIDGIRVQWKQNGTMLEAPNVEWNKDKATKLVATFPDPLPKGDGKFTLISPRGLHAIWPLQVKT